MSNYAAADTKTQWFASSYRGSPTKPNNGVLHTTEGTGWPSYDGGASAPHYTGLPLIKQKRLAWRAHFPDEMSSRALRNEAGGVETNTLHAIQVELIGTCALGTHLKWKLLGYPHIYWPKAPEWALIEVAKLVADMYMRHGVAIRGPGQPWLAYPKSYGSVNGQRMSFTQWRNHYGWAGHQHIPENCVHPDTPILCADLSWRPAGALQVGDEIVGFDEETHRIGNCNGGRRYRTGVVTQNRIGSKDSYRLVTTQGEVIASADHPWLVRLPYVNRGSRIAWVPTRDLDPIRHRIISIGEPWQHEDTWVSGWLAGLLDADGHAFAGKRHGSWAGFGQVDGDVLDHFLIECDRRGWTMKVIQRDWGKRKARLSENPKPFTDVRILGGMWQTLRVLGTLKPKRLLGVAQDMWEGAAVGKTTGDVAVLRVEPLGDQPVASLTTSIGTYIADGLLCHNTHGDPGALDWTFIEAYAQGLIAPPSVDKATPQVDRVLRIARARSRKAKGQRATTWNRIKQLAKSLKR